MRKFTVKDFITYNNPCFNCGEQINFRFCPRPTILPSKAEDAPSHLRPVVTSTHTEVDLLITYSSSLKLGILHKTNKIITNDKVMLSNYLKDHRIFLFSACTRCRTLVQSQHLDFNLDREYVEAVGLNREKLIAIDNKTDSVYEVESSFPEGKSTLVVRSLKITPANADPLTLELPLIPKYNFKNKEHFITKMKTYVLFS